LFHQIRALLYVLSRGQQNTAFINNNDRKRTIFIDTLGISSTDFNLSDKQINSLLKSGENAADKFIKDGYYINNANSR
jgi:NTE family protein